MLSGAMATSDGPSRSAVFVWIAGIVLAVLAGITLLGIAVFLVADDEDMPLVLTSDDNGTVYRLHLDEVIVVALDSNATTGYAWAIDNMNETIVRYQGSSYIAPSNGAVGEGGTEEWAFRAVEPGTTSLSLKYWRPWEGDASIADRFEITFEVRD